jgi:hypothetical protein
MWKLVPALSLITLDLFFHVHKSRTASHLSLHSRNDHMVLGILRTLLQVWDQVSEHESNYHATPTTKLQVRTHASHGNGDIIDLN